MQAAGSSPRARGTPRPVPAAIGNRRIIPASAGNTRRDGKGIRLNADHPRERGEHKRFSQRSRCIAGSSPRARGTLAPVGGGQTASRIIPASAGNTEAHFRHRYAGPDHPRERGEHSRPYAASHVSNGSSPRARGTLKKWIVAEHDSRIIPASAGNTGKHTWTAWVVSDHPRERGEHSVWSLLKLRHFSQARILTGPCDQC